MAVAAAAVAAAGVSEVSTAAVAADVVVVVADVVVVAAVAAEIAPVCPESSSFLPRCPWSGHRNLHLGRRRDVGSDRTRGFRSGVLFPTGLGFRSRS